MIAAQSPAERLVLSRQRLHQALTGTPAEPAPGNPASRPAAPWWTELKALPVAGVVIDAAQQWWARHPLRASTQLAFSAVQAIVAPVAQRHPLALVCGALAVGALLAWQRPWRWALRPALTSTLLAGLLPQLLLSSLTAQAQRAAKPPARP